MNQLEEWHFSFGLCAKEDGQLVSEDQASELMDVIIEHAEKHGLCIGGSFGPFKDDSE